MSEIRVWDIGGKIFYKVEPKCCDKAGIIHWFVSFGLKGILKTAFHEGTEALPY
jgi:hypothetical protein